MFSMHTKYYISEKYLAIFEKLISLYKRLILRKFLLFSESEYSKFIIRKCSKKKRHYSLTRM
jgi:hypothetical protein